MTVALISHPACHLHDNGSPYHPESPDRLPAIQDQLIISGVGWVCQHYDAIPATREQLACAHDRGYIEQVFQSAPTEEHTITSLDGDTSMNTHTLDAALHAAGANIMALDLLMQESHKHAACLVRPPGHHAGRAHAAGFCIFNNIAIAATYAMEKYALKRIAIVDFDVHHGDGTEEIFINEPRVLFCSSFQHPFYPYQGTDTNASNIINLPMPAGTGSTAWRENMRTNCLPKLEAFKPQLMLISAGFDSHREDDMGGFNLLEADYTWITRELCQIAQHYGEGRVLSSLEGGYDLSSLGRSLTAHVKAMAEFH